MKKYLLIGVIVAASFLFVRNVDATGVKWGKCVLDGSQCGTDNGTQSREVKSYADPICPKWYHVQNSGNWNQRCHRDYNWMQPEHKAPLGCPEGYNKDGANCSKTTTEYQACHTGEIDYSACEEAGQCPTECGYDGGEVADGKGGYTQCPATDSCSTIRWCFPSEEGYEAQAIPDNQEPEEGFAWETGMDRYCEFEEVEESTPSEKPKTFSKDTRCHDTTPPAITWINVDDGSANNNWFPQATWSAEGGDTIEVCFSETQGDPRWCFKMENDGHQELGHVAPDNTGLLGMVQYYANWRTINGCKAGAWTAVDWFN